MNIHKYPFASPSAYLSHKKELTENVSCIVGNKFSTQQPQAVMDPQVPMDYLKSLVSIATNAWRANMKMKDATTGEIREDMKRVYRHIDAIYRNLAEVGIEIRDHTGEAYDEGQPMKVIANKATQGLSRKRISETLLPSIFWNGRLIQNGEIEIETPFVPNTTVESQSL